MPHPEREDEILIKLTIDLPSSGITEQVAEWRNDISTAIVRQAITDRTSVWSVTANLDDMDCIFDDVSLASMHQVAKQLSQIFDNLQPWDGPEFHLRAFRRIDIDIFTRSKGFIDEWIEAFITARNIFVKVYQQTLAQAILWKLNTDEAIQPEDLRHRLGIRYELQPVPRLEAPCPQG